jgi:hypothetical protein
MRRLAGALTVVLALAGLAACDAGGGGTGGDEQAARAVKSNKDSVSRFNRFTITNKVTSDEEVTNIRFTILGQAEPSVVERLEVDEATSEPGIKSEYMTFKDVVAVSFDYRGRTSTIRAPIVHGQPARITAVEIELHPGSPPTATGYGVFLPIVPFADGALPYSSRPGVSPFERLTIANQTDDPQQITEIRFATTGGDVVHPPVTLQPGDTTTIAPPDLREVTGVRFSVGRTPWRLSSIDDHRLIEAEISIADTSSVTGYGRYSRVKAVEPGS